MTIYSIKKYSQTLLGLLFFFLFLSLSANLSAQDFWKKLTKPGGEVINAFAHSGKDTLYIGAYGGAYISTDDGATWQRHGLKYIGISSMYCHTNGVLYAGTNQSYGDTILLWRKANYTAEWETLPFPSNSYINYITATKNNYLFVSTHAGTYQSSDGGASWNEIKFNGASHLIQKLVELNDGTLFVKSVAHDNAFGIFRSTDQGETWESVGFSDKRITGLDANSQGVLYAMNNNSRDSQPSFIYKSDNGGDSWEEISVGFDPYDLKIDKEDVMYMTDVNMHILGNISLGVVRINGSIEDCEFLDSGLVPNPWGFYNIEFFSLSRDNYLYTFSEHLLYRSVHPVTTGIAENNVISLQVGPNPFIDELHIDGFAANSATLSVFDTWGREVHRQQYTGEPINLSRLSAGVYLLRVETDGQRGVHKIVKR